MKVDRFWSRSPYLPPRSAVEEAQLAAVNSAA